MEEQTKEIQDYIVAVRKRLTSIIAIFSVVLVMTVSIAFLLPAIYQSSSTILIEQQEIPPELVMSTVTSYAAERIQIIQARVMSRTNLIKIIEKFDLYTDERKYKTNEEIIDKIRGDVSLDVISAEVVDPRTGRPSSATIAFSLGYKGENPGKVQRVANELTTLYLNENLTSRTQKAQDTSEFFQEETKRLGDKINALESKLAKFKQENASALPELQGLNLEILQRKETELTTIDARLRTLDEKVFYLSGQLAQLDMGNPNVPDATDRLKVLLVEYASARSKYSAEHPDVLRLKNEISTLEAETGKSASGAVLAEEIELLKAELLTARKKYTAEHPDVLSLQDKIASLSEKLDELNSSPVEEHYEGHPSNPAYITVKAQLAGIESEIKSVKVQRQMIVEKISEIEKILYEAPHVEREYLVLKRDYQNAVRQYQETKAKQMRADVAKQLESESKGERFTLIDPASLPEKPISPNRPAIVVLGLLLALGCGIGFAIVADVISGTVRGVRSVQRLLGVLPLAVIPYEMNLQDRAKTKRIKKRIVLLFISVIVFALIFIHFVVSPLDVLWFRLLRKIDILLA